MFHAYIVICASTNKKYVGVTGGSIEERWKWHLTDAKRRTGSALWAAIRKYGSDCFNIQSVACAKSLPDILAIERLLIVQYCTFAPNGYNLTMGGEGRFGFKPSPESVEKSAAKHRGRPCHPNTRRMASQFHKGKPKSESMKAKLSASLTGTHRSKETKAKLAAYWAERRSRGDFKTPIPYAHHK